MFFIQIFTTEMYIKDIKSGCTVSNTEPCVLAEAAATAHVDGKNLLGPVVGVYCMNVAIKKAIENGIGMVVAKGGIYISSNLIFF